MSARVFLRNCVYMAQDLKACLFPAQLVDVVRGRDFDAAGRAADQLADKEAEEEVWERPPACWEHHRLDAAYRCENPLCRTCTRQPDIQAWNITAVLKWMQDNRTTDVLVQCGYCNRIIGTLPDWSKHLLTCDPDDAIPTDPLAASAPNPRSDVAGVGPHVGLEPPVCPTCGLSNPPKK